MTTASETTQASPVSRRRLGIGGAVGGSVLIAALVLGAVPRMGQQQRLAAAVTEVRALPVVSVATVERATTGATVALPGALTAVRTAAIYARTPGYVRERLVDIGSRVRAGQLLAYIDAPDLDQQVVQAQAVVAQMRAAAALAMANLTRWRALAADSAVTVQELDQMQATFDGAVAGQRSAAANLRRLLQLQEYKRVVAPFAGVITARNVDPGALVGTAGGVSETLPAGSGRPPLGVPATALVIRDGPPQVVIVDADSTVHYRTVNIARDHGSWVEVTGGLADGARIVVSPSEDLQEGARVRVAVTRGQ